MRVVGDEVAQLLSGSDVRKMLETTEITPCTSNKTHRLSKVDAAAIQE